MSPLLLAAILAAVRPPAPAEAPAQSPPPAPACTLAEAVALVEAGTAADAVAAAVRACGAYIPLEPEKAVRLHFDGVPPGVLEAVFASSGKREPRVSAGPGEIELLYDGFRIVGRRGPGGEPVLSVSGYAGSGERLKPAAEPPEHAAAARRAPRATSAASAPAPVEVAEVAEVSRERVLDALLRELEERPPAAAEPAAPPVTIQINNNGTGVPGGSPYPYETVYLASPWRYANVEPPRRSVEPSVGFSWTSYIPLSWPAFSGRPDWRFEAPPPAVDLSGRVRGGGDPGPAPHASGDRRR